MDKICQHPAAARERWPRILIACLALALAFGLGMYVQTQRAAAEAEDDLYWACVNMESHLSSPEIWLRLPYFQALESPMEDPGIKAEMAHIRRWAARILEAELVDSQKASDAPISHAYLRALAEELLGSSCPDAPSVARLFALCEPLESALENCASQEALLPALEAELAQPSGTEVLALLELSSEGAITTQGGT